MKVLLVNYRYFISGGPERYLFNLTNALENRGHEVIPFSIKYTKNQPTAFSKYFVSPLGNETEVYFKDQRKDLKTIWKTAKRLFYDKEVEDAVRGITSDTKPDVAYILQYLRKLSPALLVGLKRERIPIVVRLSDFAMLCPQAHFLRDDNPCELCIQGLLINSIRFRCVQGSLAISTLNYLATNYHYLRKYFDLIDKFVVTNLFMYQKMLAAGYTKDRLVLIPTFVNAGDYSLIGIEKKKLIVYVGRIERIKGVHVLIEAINKVRNPFIQKGYQLRIIGNGDSSYTEYLKNMVREYGLSNVIFTGEVFGKELSDYLSEALISVVPSLWFENLPNVVLESFACGTAVAASNHGSLRYMVDDGKTGFLFQPGSADDLAQKISLCMENPRLISEMGKLAREKVEKENSEQGHVTLLLDEFEKLNKCSDY